MPTVLYPASFDPITNGHLEIIKTASMCFESVVVLIANNPAKKYMFTPDQRIDLVKKAISHHIFKNVTVDYTEDLTAHYARDHGISIILRGLRNEEDFLFEQSLQDYSQKIQPNLQFLSVMTPQDQRMISSSNLKKTMMSHNLKKYAPPATADAMVEHFIRQTVEKLLPSDVDISSEENPETHLKHQISNRLIEESKNIPRLYHTLYHVVDLLNHPTGLQRERLKKEDFDALSWAILFHDALYDPKSKNNEENSLNLFHEFLGKVLSPAVVQKVETMILASKNHQKAPSDPLTDLFLDLDLSILGQDWNIYKTYSEDIRLEYISVPTKIFQEKRTEFLTSLLESGKIYRTPFFKNTYEPKALDNIEREIKILTTS